MKYTLALIERLFIISTLQDFEAEREATIRLAKKQLADLDTTNPAHFAQITSLMQDIEKYTCASSMVYLAKTSTEDINAEYDDTQLIEAVRHNAVDMWMYLANKEKGTPNYKALQWAFEWLRDALYEQSSLRVNPSAEEKAEEIKYCAQRAEEANGEAVHV